MTPLEIRNLENVGAEVLGCDLASLTVGDGDQLEAAFNAFGLLVIRDQAITSVELVDFARRWGDLVDAPSAQRHPDLSTVAMTSSVSETPGSWHAGDSFRAEPSAGFVVMNRSTADDAGVTHFASTREAFSTLSGPTQRALEGLVATHEDPGSAVSATHPVVIRHPRSHDASLYVNPASTTAVVGMAEQPSLSLLNELFEHGQREEFVLTLEWEPGTVVLYDSRSFWVLDHTNPERGPSTTSSANRFECVRIAGAGLLPAVRQNPRDRSVAERAAATLAGGIITAAMVGIAEVLEPEKVKSDIEIVSEAPEREPLDDGFDFGQLPPLD